MDERPPRDGSWSLIIVTMLFVAFGVWSWYQINELQRMRREVRELRSQVDNHQVEISRLKLRLLEEVDSHPE